MSSNITTEKYSLPRIERIRHYLESCAEKEKPKFYEIFVDNLKAVEKTNDLSAFDEYKMYIDDDTQMVKMLIYTGSENSPRNDKFIFSLNNGGSKPETLNGAEIETRISNAIEQERDKILLLQTIKELEDTKTQLAEVEEYSDSLEEKLIETKKELRDLQNRKISVSEMNVGNIAGYFTDYLVQNHPTIAKKIPGISALSGLLNGTGAGSTAATPEQPKSETGASFIKKETPPPTDTETQIKLEFINQMEKALTEEQLLKAMQIMRSMIDEPDSINPIHELVFQTKNK
jgi:hypothetical protein